MSRRVFEESVQAVYFQTCQKEREEKNALSVFNIWSLSMKRRVRILKFALLFFE